MKDELISFKTAKLAKEKSFDEQVNYVYNQFGKHFISNSGLLSNHERIKAPTQSLLQKWLREECNIFVIVVPNDSVTGVWHYYVEEHHTSNKEDLSEHFHNYEEALEEGLQQGLKLI